MKTGRAFILVLVPLTIALGCDRAEPVDQFVETPIEFGAGSVRIETDSAAYDLGVDVAATDPQRRRGLMLRPSLDVDSGMIFLFDEVQPAEDAFYMYNTLIPLSIAFIQPDGRIGSIREMEPCTSPYPQWCENYAAGIEFQSALEVNAGYFRDRGIGVGDRVDFRPE